MVSTFVVLLTCLFVMVLIFLLQHDSFYLWSWDELLLGQKISIVYDGDANIVYIERTYLPMEPIFSLFLLFLGVVVTFQFGAMVLQFTKRPDEDTEKRHIDIAKEPLKSDNDLDENNVPRRETLPNLMRVREIERSNREYEPRHQPEETHEWS